MHIISLARWNILDQNKFPVPKTHGSTKMAAQVRGGDAQNKDQSQKDAAEKSARSVFGKSYYISVAQLT